MTQDLRVRIDAVLAGHDLCVLATVNPDGSPHTSLLAYHFDRLAGRILLASLTDTRKWRNIKTDPRVSLLVDTRLDHAPDQQALAQALTVTGVATPATDEESLAAKARILAGHPHMKDFLELPEVRAMVVRPKGFLLVDGLGSSHFVEAR